VLLNAFLCSLITYELNLKEIIENVNKLVSYCNKNSIKPCITYELLDSPGCTLPVKIIAFLFAIASNESLKFVIINNCILTPSNVSPI